MNDCVKILSSDDGEEREKELQYWHLYIDQGGCFVTFCEGEAFGYGVSGCEYELKTTKRAGITCPKCIKLIKEIKSVKL